MFVDLLLVFDGLTVSGIRKDGCVEVVAVTVDGTTRVLSQFVLLIGDFVAEYFVTDIARNHPSICHMFFQSRPSIKGLTTGGACHRSRVEFNIPGQKEKPYDIR